MANFTKVFVYGTLKKGFANHHLLQNVTKGTVQFVSTGHTKEIFPLVVGTDAFIPFMLPLKGHGKVHGEIYEVDSNVLQSLDKLEGHPTWYKRELCEIITASADTTVECFAYFLTNPSEKMLSLEYLNEFSQHCNHTYAALNRSRHHDAKSQSQGSEH